MGRLKFWWSLVLALLSVPYAVLFVTGSIWLYQNRYLWEWLAVSVVAVLAGLLLMQWLRKRNLLERAAPVQAGETWPATGRTAWGEVDAIAKRVQAENPAMDRPEELWRVLQEVLDTVARHYHPKARHPVLQTPVPDVLRIVELVARDLREAFAERVPGSHILTINDLRGLWRLTHWGQDLYFFYKVLIFGFNPVAGLLREIRDAATDQLVGTSGGEIKRWAIGFCVRKAGYYAIQLYSGHLAVDDPAFQAYQTRQSRRDAHRMEGADQRTREEPLRILVLGQVKAGKSSLVNALFGQMRSAVDIVPRTRQVEPYLLERDGIPRALVLDTCGYDDASGAPAMPPWLREEIAHCDLAILTCSATSAARGVDRRLLDEFRTLFQSQPDRMPPPLVVALTHIDLLRPLAEWEPPYNLAEPDRPKARNIADAAQAVAEDLGLASEEPVVPVCLKPDYLYNVDEGLAAAIIAAAPEAERVKFLRSLREYRDEEYWRQLWAQTVHSGRILWRAGSALAARWYAGKAKK